VTRNRKPPKRHAKVVRGRLSKMPGDIRSRQGGPPVQRKVGTEKLACRWILEWPGSTVYESEALGSGCRSILQKRTHWKPSVRESASALNNHHCINRASSPLPPSIRRAGMREGKAAILRRRLALADRPRAMDRGTMRRKALDIPTPGAWMCTEGSIAPCICRIHR
jgi:hypothetical protein